MNLMPELSGRQLKAEARDLEYLLRSYIADREFIGDDHEGAIVYFVDAHEIKSFIDPDDDGNLTGFVLNAERAVERASKGLDLDLRLKNDLILRQLLFEQRVQVGLLPSHGEEVDEEIAYKQLHVVTARIALLEKARSEWHRLRAAPKTRRLLALATGKPSNSSEHQQLVDFFREAAPTLIALLQPSPTSPQHRIKAIVEKSYLVRLSDLSWEAFGFGEDECRRLRGVIPSEESCRVCIGYLSSRKERRHNSFRSNRVDGEALAYLRALNDELGRIPAPRVAARLVTRAMTLINASRSSDLRLNFVRHPRLLTLQGGVTTLANDRHAANALAVSLQTYQAQLSRSEDAAATYSGAELGQVVERLLQAWHQFEQARFAVDLKAQLDERDSASNENDTELQDLIDWLKQDPDMLSVVQKDLLKTIGQFGQATFALERAEPNPNVQAMIIELVAPTRARIYPMMAGAPGPVEFSELPRTGERRVCSLEELTAAVPSYSPERYLAWSLLFACEGRWSLAAIYAESAAAIASLLQPATARDEARLLRAKIRRLSGMMAQEERGEDVIRHYRRNLENLSEGGLAGSPRVLRERAAQLLEMSLHPLTLGTGSLRDGIELLHSAHELAGRDDLVRSRILELGISYHLAAETKPDLWPDRGVGDLAVLQTWHNELRAILSQQRHSLMMEEISRRARAMEMIGFQLIGRAEDANARPTGARETRLLIPAPLRLDMSEIREQVAKSKDLIAKLICNELDLIIQYLQFNKPRDLIYAPVWASYDAETIMSRMPSCGADDLVGRAYELIIKVAGASLQTGVHPSDRPPLEEAERLFGAALNILLARPAAECGPQRNTIFYLRMEQCYARLLLTRIASLPERPRLLEALELHYRKIAADYPEASIPLFRLNVVLAELDRDDEAFAALTEALRLVDRDPYLQTPNHWVRSTMQRRLASRMTEAAEKQIDNIAHDVTEAGKDVALRHLLEAFRVMYTGWNSPESPVADYLYQLEAKRRINNIVYIASLILKLDPGGNALRKLDFGIDQLRSMIERLHEGRIEAMTEQALVHTVGHASFIIRDFPTAAQAGRRLMDIVIETGENPRKRQIARLIADAIIWQGTQTV